MTNRIISDLIGTMQSFFKIGTLRLKNNTNVLEVKNSGDTGFLPISASTAKLNNGSGTATLQSASSGTLTFTLPGEVGSTNQVLTTDGNTGVLSWSTVAVANNQVLAQTENIVFGSSTPVTMFTPPDNSVIQKIVVDVDTAFDATGGPNLSVGVSGTTSKYMGATDSDLATVGIYEVQPMIQESTSNSPVIITYSAGTGGSAGSAFVTVFYANPG